MMANSRTISVMTKVVDRGVRRYIWKVEESEEGGRG